MNDLRLVADYVSSHIRHAELMKIAWEHVHPDDAARDFGWYHRAEIADAGKDPTQVLQRLPWVLEACSSSASPNGEIFRASISAEALASGVLGPEGGPDIVGISQQIAATLPAVNLVGCFKPYRYKDASGLFVFEADMLIWGCDEPALKVFAADMERRHARVSESRAVVTWSKISCNDFKPQLLETMWVPDRQYITELEFSTAYSVALDFCAEIELKEVLKQWPFRTLVFAQGDGKKFVPSNNAAVGNG